MDALDFYGLQRTEDPNFWQLPVVPTLCSGLGALFGGCGLGACVEALERVTGRPLVWATGQYLSYARPPSVMDIRITEVVRGHQISQARALATVDGDEILTVNAALGERPVPFQGEWAVRPDVPPPEDCPPRQVLERHEGTIMDRIEMRIAHARGFDELDGTPGDGRSALWVRLPGVLEMSAAALAIVGDYVPFGISQSLGHRAGGNSLDNTLRVASRVPTDWILADIRVHAIAHGFGHGLVHLWAHDGTLLGTASQSTIVRAWREEHSPERVRSAEDEATQEQEHSPERVRSAEDEATQEQEHSPERVRSAEDEATQEQEHSPERARSAEDEATQEQEHSPERVRSAEDEATRDKENETR